jgi:putative membrane protein
VAFLVGASAVIVALHGEFGIFPEVDAFGFTTFGIALSLFLGFRNNAAYERWWEARKLWGGLLADVRSFARETLIFIADENLNEELLRLTLAFLHLHRCHLRNVQSDDDSLNFAPDLMNQVHPPCAALDQIAKKISLGVNGRTIDGFGARTLSERLSSMAFHQAGCERIAGTPLPFVYSLLIYRTTYLYCLLLPLALVGPAGWLTPIFVGIVGYMFLGLAEVSEELSHPFGVTPNALPLDSICRTAEIAIASHLGDPIPAPLVPKNFYLS